ncbi:MULTISPECIES: VanZ family protein [unclassified Rhizobium]|uniref:VanZ family protein n=1 Tax=unclassified Rhizobium TaxID=2613769 RepID=UPI001AEEE85A|nr:MULTISPECIES: VanZ family protein [unclassified Rhizobium]MCV3767218.1 VanZ family protein [Rhizobium sp. TRM95796]
MTDRIAKILAWSALAVIIFVTVSPIGLRPQDFGPVNFDRGLAFAGLSALFVLAYPKAWATTLAVLVVAAFGIEALQELSPSRHARIDDALVKAAGAVIGAPIGYATAWMTQRVRRARA